MEVLGAVASGVTLAALFKCTFEALDLIHLYQTQDIDFKRLQLRYSLEKCRLYNWGVEMGLADESKQNLLSEWHSKELVAETLRQIIALFSDAQIIRKKYGCDDAISSTVPALPAPKASHGITRAFDHFRMQSSNSDEIISPLKKTKWVIRDRKKFLVLVSELRSLIDSLEKITNDLATTARLEEFLRIRINGITNVDTLFEIASVWKDSHPRVASAASTKADTISMISGRYEFVSQWQKSVDNEASGVRFIADIEDLSITELKHSVVSSHEELQTLERSLHSISDYLTSLDQHLSIVLNQLKAQKYAAVFMFLIYTSSLLCFPEALDIQDIKSLSWSELTVLCIYSLLLNFPWMLHFYFLCSPDSFPPITREHDANAIIDSVSTDCYIMLTSHFTMSAMTHVWYDVMFVVSVNYLCFLASSLYFYFTILSWFTEQINADSEGNAS